MILEKMNHFLRRWRPWAIALTFCVLGLASVSFPSGDDQKSAGQYIAVDFHQHSTYTDGANSIKTVMYKNNRYGLGFWANSEHGGARATDGRGPLNVGGPFDLYDGTAWTDYPPGTILGDANGGKMWRWQSLRDFSFRDIVEARAEFLKPIVQGLEWNVPGHEHCSVGIIAGQFDYSNLNADAIAEFEYLFDASDSDSSGGPMGDTDKNFVNDHEKAVKAAEWMEKNYPHESWMVFAHPERKGTSAATGGYSISDFRDFNNAAPDVAFGFESMPGHQKEGNRGGYGSGAAGGGTYGGTGIYAAQVGGLWDAMLGEGRSWWLFASSDFHNTGGDFWPGEYEKTYVHVSDPRDPQAVVDGLRSGNSFVVEGDLIDGLDFSAGSPGLLGTFQQGATMGETFRAAKKQNNIRVVIRFHSPDRNNNGDPVAVDHIDLIAGGVTGKIDPSDTGHYNVPENPTTQVIASFCRRDFRREPDGWFTATREIKLSGNAYLRLRGTNLARNTENETDTDGNPLPDSLVGANSPEKAWADLWFYSNPIFITVK